ncbi:hypothetical protein PG996_003198 [Apiospora saccharicola]|uniref:Uncharacterized protein n=1 Tax=Apiospora saccharicola TaxID=335842 RepID=A0ABR1W4F4_9PEZI
MSLISIVGTADENAMKDVLRMEGWRDSTEAVRVGCVGPRRSGRDSGWVAGTSLEIPMSKTALDPTLVRLSLTSSVALSDLSKWPKNISDR